MSDTPASAISRRHDFDALRAFAMLLGMAFHGSFSFYSRPWAVQDLMQNETLRWFAAAIHGFRMPLFILVSGYFTMMLWRQRGLIAMLKQRFERVFIPCILVLITLVPVTHRISSWARESALRREAQGRMQSGPTLKLVESTRRPDLSNVERHLSNTLTPLHVDSGDYRQSGDAAHNLIRADRRQASSMASMIWMPLGTEEQQLLDESECRRLLTDHEMQEANHEWKLSWPNGDDCGRPQVVSRWSRHETCVCDAVHDGSAERSGGLRPGRIAGVARRRNAD